MTRRIDLFRLPLDIVRSCFVATATRSCVGSTSLNRFAAGLRCYSQVREEGPLWDAKKKKSKMSRPEDHQITEAGRKAPGVPKPSSRFVQIGVGVRVCC